MTVGTPHNAKINLLLNSFKGISLIDHLAYIHLFCSHYMIECQNHWISYSTIHAWMTAQIGEYKVLGLVSFPYLAVCLVGKFLFFISFVANKPFLIPAGLTSRVSFYSPDAP
jgi:hypothetical protein